MPLMDEGHLAIVVPRLRLITAVPRATMFVTHQRAVPSAPTRSLTHRHSIGERRCRGDVGVADGMGMGMGVHIIPCPIPGPVSLYKPIGILVPRMHHLRSESLA
jgi:hypothetical protein